MLRKCNICVKRKLVLLPLNEDKVVHYQMWKNVSSTYEKEVEKKDGTVVKELKTTRCPTKVTEAAPISKVLQILYSSLAA